MYPLRRCSSDICLEIIGESAFPIFARISIMKLILGPACFIMDDRKLTTKLANHITELLRQDSFEDIEFRALVNRIANKLGIIRILSEGDQQKIRIEGIQFTLLGPASLANAVLGLRDKEDEVMLALLLTQGELRPSGNLSGQTRRRLLEVALRTGEASGSSHKCNMSRCMARVASSQESRLESGT
ncbi:hypothetical protein BGZ83_011849 [Gryganskiella cystojenkinii]|nr:hypothetical protein BGZ83_011849 [Gryganskiella cystojenkinii]